MKETNSFKPSEDEIKDIINLYTVLMYTLRHISEIFNTNHHHIKRILLRNSIPIGRRRTKKPTSLERIELGRRLAEKYSKWVNNGRKATKTHLYKNMKAHLKYDITLEWLMSFEDIEKLKFLNKSITKEYMKIGFETTHYINFIEKFYHDLQFNLIYEKWLLNKDNKWLKPSLDHIHPRSDGGSITDLDNLQFLTWLENKCKSTLSIDEWCDFKNNINNYFIECN